jgi:hypothetical protein
MPHAFRNKSARFIVDNTDFLFRGEPLRNKIFLDELSIGRMGVGRDDKQRAGQRQTAAEDIIQRGYA